MSIHTYKEAKEVWDTRKVKRDKKKLENHTYLVQRGDNFAILLHQTDIVTYTPNGDVILNTGGWKTVTTRGRINEFLPFDYKVGQTRGQWDLWRWKPGQERKSWQNREQESYPFIEGITITVKGAVKNAGSEVTVKAEKRRQKLVNDYIGGFILALRSCKLHLPGGGDCWLCAMHTQDGKSLGDSSNDEGHIAGHIRERYYVPSLLANAVEAFPVSLNAKQYIALKFTLGTKGAELPDWVKKDEQQCREQVNDVAERQIRDSLKKYIDKRVTIAALAA